MPSVHTRTTTGGMTTAGVTTGARKVRRRARARTSRRTGMNAANPNVQYLSLSRDAGNQVIANRLTGNKLAIFVNGVCALAQKDPAILEDPNWIYSFGEQIFGGTE